MVKQIGDIKLYSVDDLHKGFDVNQRTIRDWFKKKRLKGVKLGKHWFITEENLKTFLNGEKGGEERVTRRLKALTKTRKKGGRK